MKHRPKVEPRFPWAYVIAFAVGAAAVAAFMWHHVAIEREVAMTHWRARLTTSADDRVRLVSTWLDFRRGDLEVLAAFAPLRAALMDGAADGRSDLTQHLDRVATAYGYAGIHVVHASGHLVARSTAMKAPSPDVVAIARYVAASGRFWVDLPMRDGRSTLLVAAPVLADAKSRPPLGAIVVLMHPERGLLSVLGDQSLATRTGETLLVRRHQERGGYLSPLRHQVGTWEQVAHSLQALGAPGQRATFLEMLDYRGVPVLAVPRDLGHGDLELVLKIDLDEALAEFYQAGRLAAVAAGFLLMALAGLLIGHWRERQQAQAFAEQIRQHDVMVELTSYAETLVASVPSGLLVLSPDRRVVSANRWFLERFGLSADDIAGRALHEVIPAAGLPRNCDEVLANGVGQQGLVVEAAVAGASTTSPLAISITRIRLPGERRPKLLLTVEDLTESERLRATAEASQQRYRDLVDGFDAIAWEADADTLRFSFVSRHAEAVLGYPVERWLHDPGFSSRYVHPDDRAQVVERYRAAVRDGDEAVFEYRGVAADGRVVWLRDRLRVVRDGHGRPLQVRGLMVDTTERREAEEALRESERRFRAIFDEAAIGIFRVDLDGQIVETNPALQEMLGYDATELRAMTLGDLSAPEDAVTDAERFRELLDGRRDHHCVEKRYHRRDGASLWGNVTLSVVRRADGRPQFCIGMIENVTERKAQSAALERQALFDVLTELPNRTLLYDRLKAAIATTQRERQPFALLIMDLDGFKEVNDTFGHFCGDVLLQQVGRRVRGTLRESDTVARLGGDEFALLLRKGSDAILVAGKILKALEQPFAVEGQMLNVGASIGIVYCPEHGLDADALMRRADVAMYVAKRTNGGYAVYTADQDQHSPGQLALTGELRHGIEQNELVLHYQPKVLLRSGRVEDVETLVRWQHPRAGLVLPDRFIRLTEQTGLIRPLTEWVLNAALQQCDEWRRAGRDLRIAVNLSARNLQDPRLPEVVAGLLRTWSVDPARLELEITESAIMANPEHALESLSRLSEMGVRLSIDDFGTGYSSLAYIKRFPVDEIKIDKAFVMDMAVNENDAAIVRSIVDLAHNLGMSVVAEGVENRETWDLLAEMGCDLAQGFYLSRALPEPELIQWLDRRRAERTMVTAIPSLRASARS